MNFERDPRPAVARADDRDAFLLADEREGVAKRRLLRHPIEAIFDRVEPRLEAGEQAAQIGLAAQPCCLKSRLAAMRSRSAFRRMKPAASRWS